MAGSDRVPDPERFRASPTLETRKSATRAKWRSSMSAHRSVPDNVLDTADIVRDRDFSPTIAARSLPKEN